MNLAKSRIYINNRDCSNQLFYQESEQAGEAEKYMMDFEKEEGMVQQALTTRNASYLIDQRCKDTISDRCCGAWTLWSAHALVSSIRDTVLVLLVRDTILVSRLVVDDLLGSNRLGATHFWSIEQRR